MPSTRGCAGHARTVVALASGWLHAAVLCSAQRKEGGQRQPEAEPYLYGQFCTGVMPLTAAYSEQGSAVNDRCCQLVLLSRIICRLHYCSHLVDYDSLSSASSELSPSTS